MTKEVSFSIDTNQLTKDLATQRAQDEQEYNNSPVRTSTFAFGLDPRVSNDQIASVDFTSIEILKDGLANPFLQLNWQIKREFIDANRIALFRIFRRSISADSLGADSNSVLYTRNAVDKIAKKSKKTGKFSEEKKALTTISRGSVPLVDRNSFAYQAQLDSLGKSYQDQLPDAKDYTSVFSSLTAKNVDQLIGVVTPAAFLANTNKFVVSKDKNIQSFYFRDKAIAYQDTYEYYIESIGIELGNVSRSSRITVVVLGDMTPISPPELTIKQSKESELNVTVTVKPEDFVQKVLVYKRSEDQINFGFFFEAEMLKDSLIFTDSDIIYGKKYIYRVFSVNIHGVLSEPSEDTEFFVSVQRITPESRSNNLKIPILSAVQDQNSDYIKINIFPNDPLVAYYELERRDLTIKEKKFSVPSKTNTNYGGVGWVTNKFFVEKTLEPLKTNVQNFLSKISLKEIQFIDDTIQMGHIYQYRVRGCDLFTNGSSYSFALVKASTKKTLRVPINIRLFVLRGYPYRIALIWDDDNATSPDKGKLSYKVQRRKAGETVYESFPITPNIFIVDEVPTLDAVNFNSLEQLDTSSLVKLENLSVSEKELQESQKIRRSFGLPNFLEENETYYYRVISVLGTDQESNATEEFKVITVPDLSPPTKLSAVLLNEKVSPITAKLSWTSDTYRSLPDHWVIERKFDSPNEAFRTVGRAYLQSEYIDYNIKQGNSYLYRVKSVDTLGRSSDYTEIRLVT